MQPDVDPQVLIVGAGPAGLAAARALAERGVSDILVIDRDDAPGGLPRFCHHPGFGLEYARWPYSGPGFVKRLLRDIDGANVRIECQTTLLALKEGPVAKIVGPRLGLRHVRPRAIILATGIRESNRGNLAIPGGRAETGIFTSGQLQQLVARKVALPDRLKSVAVIGTEHVAFSTIWTARKAGLRIRAIIGDEGRIMSFAPLATLASACGIQVMTSTFVREIETQQGATTAIILQTPQGMQRLATDGLVFTGNWIPETAALGGGPVMLDPATGGPEIDQAMRTSALGIFAAGNVLHGVESSGWCANEGRHAGLMAARFLRGEIAGNQSDRRLDLSADIDFAVPQRWDGNAVAAGIPVNLRVNKDLRDRKLTLSVGPQLIWSGSRRSFMRKRRIALPRSVSADQIPGRLRIEFIE